MTVSPRGDMRTTLHRQRPWIIVGVIVVGALAVVITGAVMAPERSSDIWVNLADSAAQIVVLALAGGVVGAVLRDRDARREDARRRQASLLAFANQVDLAFNEIKAARRILRTFGFDAPAGLVLTPANRQPGFVLRWLSSMTVSSRSRCSAGSSRRDGCCSTPTLSR